MGAAGGIAVEAAFILDHWQKRPGTVEHDVRQAIEIPVALTVGVAATATIIGGVRYMYARRGVSAENIDGSGSDQHDSYQGDESLDAHEALGEMG
jgi:hypothetical protein